MKKSIFAGATAVALAAVSATAATAAPHVDGTDIIAGTSTWTEVYTDQFYIDDMTTDASSDIWDSIGYFQFWDITTDTWVDMGCPNADLVVADDATGDQVLTCGPTTVSETLEANMSARFYADGDMVRFAYTLTNISDSAVGYDWWAWGEYGDSFETMDPTVVDAQGWEVEEGYDNNEHVGSAWGLAGSDGFPLYLEDNADDNFSFAGTNDTENNLTIGAGESVSYVFFAFHDAPTEGDNTYPSNDFVSLEAWAADTFDAFDGRLIAGLPTDIPVLNWGWGGETTVEAEEEALAETGTETGALLAGGAALVLGAAAVFAIRRRTV